MLGPKREERGVQEALSDEARLAQIRAKFLPEKLALFDQRMFMVGHAIRSPDGVFRFIGEPKGEVHYVAKDDGTAIAPGQIMEIHPAITTNFGDTVHIAYTKAHLK